MSTNLINDFIPMLICNNVEESIAFYTANLGFEVVNYDKEIGTSGFATIENGSIRLMMASPSFYEAPKGKIGKPLTDTIQYFYTDDVVALKHRLDENGISSTDFKVRFYGLKEIEIQDPDGRLLIIGQDTDEPPTPE